MQKIVEELQDTINKDINIMDENACIVASTDPARIGMHHMGAQRIITKRIPELIIDNSSNLLGTKKGINFPIVLNNEIIGVVGITGERDEVEPFGKIIKKMTEILISEEYQKEQQHLIEDSINNFVYNWILKSQNDDEKEMERIALSGELLGIDVKLSRTVIILNIDLNNKQDEIQMVNRQSLHNRIMNQFRKRLKDDKQNVVVDIGGNIIILLHEELLNHALLRIQNILDELEQHYNVKIAGGIGSIGCAAAELRQSYKEAEISCNIMMKYRDKGIKLYSDVDLEMLLQSVSHQSKLLFFNKVFSGCMKKDIDDYAALLRTLIENNGSINRTAEQLYLHKNTIQYRLNKIKETTGYNPRNMKEIVPLYIAMLIYEESLANDLRE